MTPDAARCACSTASRARGMGGFAGFGFGRGFGRGFGFGFARGFGGGGIKLAPSGFPDLVGQLVDGRVCVIEVKCPGEEIDPHQADWRHLVLRFDGVHIIAHSKAECRRAVREALGLPDDGGDQDA